jgi:hypothetical protein
MVPESTCQGETTTRSRNREAENGSRGSSAAPTSVRTWPPPPRSATVFPSSPGPHSTSRTGTPPYSSGPAWKTPYATSHPTAPVGVMPPPRWRDGLACSHGWFNWAGRIPFAVCNWTFLTSAHNTGRFQDTSPHVCYKRNQQDLFIRLLLSTTLL